MLPIEALAMVCLVCYLKKNQGMEVHCWPKLIIEVKLDRRKNKWVKKNIKWMEK